MRRVPRLGWRQGLALGVAVLAAGFAYPAWRHFHPVSAAEGWRYREVAADIPMVSALALDADGSLFVTQEFSSRRGSLLRLLPNGERQPVLGELSKPDGLVMFQGGLVVSQEGGPLPVFLLRDGQRQALFDGNDVEGVATDGQTLYAIEDLPRGRLLSYDPLQRRLAVLRDGLEEGEGVARCPDGRLFYTEKAKGWVKQWQPGGTDTLVAAGLDAPGFVQCSADGLWITEDATHGARVLLVQPDGRLVTVLSHLRSAQTLIPRGDGHYLVAEQGRNRILEFSRDAGAAR
ncbi:MULTISPECIES: hypothetical protein [Pseudomonas]|jgi:sugar lactone lactonase YvrE|uniref:hypothetical protein n=1 Tax=Pseudomonas TaxID=286 RepID=UPI0003F5AAED|nr:MULTISPECIES: hypothetical protein [Pseudomonas]MBH3329185.1 hypothetical protein [Pseudomonas oryzihabitans]MDU4055889.1 hypothetical protein [Pseudomonas oryzihabitans]